MNEYQRIYTFTPIVYFSSALQYVCSVRRKLKSNECKISVKLYKIIKVCLSQEAGYEVLSQTNTIKSRQICPKSTELDKNSEPKELCVETKFWLDAKVR